VSVIVPTTGRASLARCVDSLLAQECDVPFEVVVVVNRAATDDLEGSVPAVRALYEPQPGPAAARNRGVRETSGDVVAFVDDDCVAAPGWLRSALATLARAGEPVVVAGNITRSGAEASWASLFDSVVFLRQESYVRRPGACVTANVVMPRAVLDRVGLFDESFVEAACEDWEWSSRARRQAVPIVFDRSAAVDHPCVSGIHELKLKAERIGRSERLLNERIGAGAGPTTLVRQVARQIRPVFRPMNLPARDRVRVACVAPAVAYWMWRAGRRERAARR
jgi:glycosyltransferase involved in cell wall biosynthesis